MKPSGHSQSQTATEVAEIVSRCGRTAHGTTARATLARPWRASFLCYKAVRRGAKSWCRAGSERDILAMSIHRSWGLRSQVCAEGASGGYAGASRDVLEGGHVRGQILIIIRANWEVGGRWAGRLLSVPNRSTQKNLKLNLSVKHVAGCWLLRPFAGTFEFRVLAVHRDVVNRGILPPYRTISYLFLFISPLFSLLVSRLLDTHTHTHTFSLSTLTYMSPNLRRLQHKVHFCPSVGAMAAGIAPRYKTGPGSTRTVNRYIAIYVSDAQSTTLTSDEGARIACFGGSTAEITNNVAAAQYE